MSWLFSRGLVEEYLAANFLDGAPYALSNTTHMPLGFLPPDKMTDVSRLSRFGMIFARLTGNLGEALLTWFREDFLARTLVAQEQEQVLTGKDQDYGEKWQGSFVKYDHNLCLWRTHQCSLLGDWDEFLETWPRWGLMRDGECWELTQPAHLTNGNESGLLPTPVKSDGAARRPSKNWEGNSDLPSVIWSICGGAENPKKSPTKLHPAFVEWMMGWPIGWTESKDVGTDRFQLWQQQHSEFYQAD